MKTLLTITIVTILALWAAPGSFAQTDAVQKKVVITVKNVEDPSAAAVFPPASIIAPVAVFQEYRIGPSDILNISVLQPQQLGSDVTVTPDGRITFPYIGTVTVKGYTLDEIQDIIQKRLADGYMKYPVVAVSLKESHSRRFFVYGAVAKSGAYDIEENMTALRGISMAGGFTQFGSSSRVKILRPKKGSRGYDVIKVNVKDIMDGVADADPAIEQGDIIVVSEGIF
ncbi:MAG: polysaccharide biosynthesis/export family protein [Candidatus Omnitrophica bacterium]|nr:polysaccharide biosynthesis/export family protein [Candidatus Omnitrophota bacterium]